MTGSIIDDGEQRLERWSPGIFSIQIAVLENFEASGLHREPIQGEGRSETKPVVWHFRVGAASLAHDTVTFATQIIDFPNVTSISESFNAVRTPND